MATVASERGYVNSCLMVTRAEAASAIGEFVNPGGPPQRHRRRGPRVRLLRAFGAHPHHPEHGRLTPPGTSDVQRLARELHVVGVDADHG